MAEKWKGVFYTRITVTCGNVVISDTCHAYGDYEGRVVRFSDAAGRVTTTGYSPDNRTATVTDPGGGTTVTTRHSDKSLLSVTGSAVTPSYHTYGVNPADGTRWTRTASGAPGSPAYETRVFNALGQLTRSEKPGFGGGARPTSYHYDGHGQLIAEDTPGEPLLEYAYAHHGSAGGGCSSCASGGGAHGERVSVTETADDVSRVRLNLSEFAEEPDGSVWEIKTRVLASSDPALPALTNTVARRLFPLDPRLESETIETDPRGNTTVTVSAFDKASCTRTSVSTAPHASAPAVTVAVDGRTVMMVSPSAVTNTFAYDTLRRSTATTDGRGNTRVTLYDAPGQITATADYLGAVTSPQPLIPNS